MVYGLTKGQASLTSQKDFNTPLQMEGVSSEPFNPISIAIALDDRLLPGHLVEI